MKIDEYSPNRFVSGLAAAAVTTVLVSSLVASFEPEQLLRFDDQTAAAQTATVQARKDGASLPGA